MNIARSARNGYRNAVRSDSTITHGQEMDRNGYRNVDIYQIKAETCLSLLIDLKIALYSSSPNPDSCSVYRESKNTISLRSGIIIYNIKGVKIFHLNLIASSKIFQCLILETHTLQQQSTYTLDISIFSYTDNEVVWSIIICPCWKD